jgi:putative ABC transport system permease protein
MNKLPPQWFDQGAGYVTMETVEWLGAGDYYNALDIVTAGQQDRQHVLAIARQAGEEVVERWGLQVVSLKPFLGEPGRHWAEQYVDGVLMVLVVAGVMCLVLSAGLVINTASSLIARQVRQIGILRSLGGGRRQIALMYLAGILYFGLNALLLGVPLGLFGARGLAAGIGSQMNFDVERVELPPSVLLLQVVVGLLIPLCAAIVPILAGTRISVYEAIYQQGSLAAVNKGRMEELLKRLKGLSSPVVLAIRNTFRHKARLLFTLATLTLAGATFMAAFSTHQTLRQEIESIGRYWLFDVALEVPEAATQRRVEAAAVRGAGVATAEGWYRATATIRLPDGSETEAIEVLAVPEGAVTLDPLVLAGRWLAPTDSNAIVVNEEVLRRAPGLRVGSEVVLNVGEFEEAREQRYSVVGIVSRHLTSPRIYAPYEYFTRANYASGRSNLVRVRVTPSALQSGEAQAALAAKLAEQFDEAGLGSGGSETQYQAVVSNTSNFDILLTVLLLMSGLLALVGGLGLAGTMSLNVLERTREIGVLRAVGATNGAVRKVVLFEGAFVGMLSWLLAAIVALPFGYVLAGVIGQAVLQASVDYQVSLRGIVLWLALIQAIAALASLAPAQRASRLTVREVLAYE